MDDALSAAKMCKTSIFNVGMANMCCIPHPYILVPVLNYNSLLQHPSDPQRLSDIKVLQMC